MRNDIATKSHGAQIKEERIGTEDRLIKFADGVWGWQARGTCEICFPDPADVELRGSWAAAVADYNAT